MKTYIKNPLLLPALIAVLNLIPAGRVTAQTFTTLHSFSASSTNSSGVYTNSDGAGPQAGLITNSSGSTLYGTAGGGSSGNGTVFAVNTDGTGFTNLHSFTAVDPNNGTNSDGEYPQAGLIFSGNTLYGTAYGAGSSGNGTVFAVNTDGTGFTTLHNFAGYPSDGANPFAGLIFSGNTLYGTSISGGSSGGGTVFAVKTDGTGFTNLHNFTSVHSGGPPLGTNSGGAFPSARLILSGNTLYGTTAGGGSFGQGMVFALSTHGTGFTNLHNFTATSYNGSCCDTNSDGVGPSGLTLSGNTLYGTANGGGSSGNGTVFGVNTDGTGFTNLHNFTRLDQIYSTNSDGAVPQSGLILSGNTLYGTASVGGASGNGTVFAVKTDGTGFTNLHSFTGGSGGVSPYAGLILSGNTLYGTSIFGGSAGNGMVFSLSFRPQLTITPSGAPPSGIILSWPTNVAGFDYTGYTLQSTTNLVPPVVWSTNSPAPVVIAGQNTVTNPITGPQQFYRLVQ